MKKWWSTLENSTGAPSLTTRCVLCVFPNLKFSVMLPEGFFRLCEFEFSFNPNISPEWVMVGPQMSHTSRALGAWEKKTNGDDAHSVTWFRSQYPNWESITCKCVLENGSMLIENMVISIHRLDNVREMDLWLNCFSNMCIRICDMGPRTHRRVREEGLRGGSPTNPPSNYSKIQPD